MSKYRIILKANSHKLDNSEKLIDQIQKVVPFIFKRMGLLEVGKIDIQFGTVGADWAKGVFRIKIEYTLKES